MHQLTVVLKVSGTGSFWFHIKRKRFILVIVSSLKWLSDCICHTHADGWSTAEKQRLASSKNYYWNITASVCHEMPHSCQKNFNNVLCLKFNMQVVGFFLHFLNISIHSLFCLTVLTVVSVIVAVAVWQKDKVTERQRNSEICSLIDAPCWSWTERAESLTSHQNELHTNLHLLIKHITVKTKTECTETTERELWFNCSALCKYSILS